MNYLMQLIVVILVSTFTSCSSKIHNSISMQGEKFVSITSYGVYGNEKKDVRQAIQRALDSEQNIYFPTGKYLIASKSTKTGMLTITEDSKVRNILFAKDAILIVSPNQPNDYIKPAVILIQANKGIIESIRIDGLNIEGKRDEHKLLNTGILAYEKKDAAILKLYLNNITIKNMGGNGIHTQARFNDFKNIFSENCGSHGIGIINTTNIGIENEFYLDGYTSIDDDAYSIDFSGPKKNKIAEKGYDWKGEVKNITSINSYYGIKTAGYWDLKLSNVIIKNSAHNGFFINVDAPEKKIELDNIMISNSNGSGLQLAGKTNFIGKRIKIEACTVGMKILKTDVFIDTLEIDGKNKSKAMIRMGNSTVTLKNFIIKNASEKDLYPIWLSGKKIVLENGKFINNSSSNEMIIHKNAKEVTLMNLSFGLGKTPKKKSAIVNIQENGNTEIIGCDFSKVNGKQIDDRSKSIQLINNIGLKKLSK